MNALALLRKSILVSLFTLSLLLNVSIGLVVVFIWRMIVGFKKMSDLLKAGTIATATVTRVEERVVHSVSLGKTRQTTTRTMYRLVAEWQHPQTGKTYTLKAPIPDPEKFPIGSTVDFLVNYDNPGIHCLADTMGAFTPIDSSSSPVQDA